ncbi:MAG: hypothetical protein P8Z35_22915 [Ignavibacteriaceae bacterium]
MEEHITKLSTYILAKRYQAEQDKSSAKAVELDRLLRDKLSIPANIDLLSTEIQDKLNEIIRAGKQKAEKFVNVTAWIFIVLTGLKFLGSIYGLMSMNTVSEHLHEINSLHLENIPFLNFIFGNLVLITMFAFVISLAMFSTSIGVLYRYNLARKAGIIFLIYEIVKAVVSPFLLMYIYPNIRNLNYKIPKSIVDTTYGSSIAISLFFSIVIIVIYWWLISRFTSPEIKEEFK